MKNKAIEIERIESFDAIKEAHALSGIPGKIRGYYNKWAPTYNRDVFNEKYLGPEYIVDYFARLESHNGIQVVDSSDRHIEILDAGCGTGLVGVALHRKGYHNIDGFDLSPRMIQKAEKTGVYRSLNSSIDMTRKNKAYKDNQYDATICCGVFTLGHVPPTALLELIRVTKPGGWVVVSTRKSYYESSDFQKVCDGLQEEGKVKLLSYEMNSPYIIEEGAHYWGFVVC
ncbi:class I SAM-dependent methyltransferase [Oscillatoria sp. HE19RPO]|uniref:class I SAM-dependent DNA methyltransferase n=1 Tax=Oscillatoria sp. HE19RPO TaxID=2954806 RepID=UPI0020C20349|nr:class I SAM-dependent methyltransferase [Oscillatoria sp. HE19RPO]